MLRVIFQSDLKLHVQLLSRFECNSPGHLLKFVALEVKCEADELVKFNGDFWRAIFLRIHESAPFSSAVDEYESESISVQSLSEDSGRAQAEPS